MDILGELRERFRTALVGFVDKPEPLLEMIRPAAEPKFGDYQANFAMSLAKQLGRPPRDVAADVAARARLDDLCQQVEVAGPGFINLRLRNDLLAKTLVETLADPFLGVPRPASPRKYVIDFSAPNVAKPMHVGHIRSTVIGDALCRLLRFRGDHVVSDNHLGDWGTQFGMVIYGYKHFRRPEEYAANPVAELSRLYRLVHSLIGYHELVAELPTLERAAADRAAAARRLADQPPAGDKAEAKKQAAAIQKAQRQAEEAANTLAEARSKRATFEANPTQVALAAEHSAIGQAVLDEVVRLHAGDAENLRLWREFMPHCLREIHAIYERLGVTFDEELGESFYHGQLADVVADMQGRGLTRESDGAVCVFLDGFDAPMIVRKRDGAFLYATTDLATIRYRVERWNPDAILYVVDHRQAEHFDKLFAAARLWGYQGVALHHIAFGTVLGKDGKPYKTRSGDTVGLEGLIDEGVRKALAVVQENDDRKPDGPEFTVTQREQIAETVGVAALKYADLSQNRTSDYEFSYEKMLALDGNTAAYMQYSYARVRGIFRKAGVDSATLTAGLAAATAAADADADSTAADSPIHCEQPAERALALALARFPEAIAESLADFRPNQLTVYLYDLTRKFSAFFEACPVVRAETDELRRSRLLLCELTGRVVEKGLELLGIRVVEKM
jgi:arginyl-tRNA synthetase